MKKHLLFLLTLWLCFHTGLGAARSPFAGVTGLIERRLPWLKGRVVFEPDKNSEQERFTLQTRRNKLYIKAGTPSAAAMGLNWYLKYYCHRQMSHMGDNLAPLSVLPVVSEAETHYSTVPLRYALNYCTFNYTYSFYTWADWERELDLMALHGVNQMLVATGAEAVWQNVLRRMGFSETDIQAFRPGPAYTAWWLMGNLEGQGGPMPLSQIESRKILTRKILSRMKELGIEPLLPGFFGMVPSLLRSKTKAVIAQQGKWISFTRPDIMSPTDPEFARIAGLFYEETARLYGKDIRYFSGDPFHEGGNTQGLDVAATGKAIQDALHRYYPDATWVFQGWQSNPRRDILSKMDKTKTLVQELFGENTANWEKRKAYEGTPFLWCCVNNFGERPGLYGKLERMAAEWYRVRHSPYASLLKGIGFMPEGAKNNPVVYELMTELPWHAEKINVEQWIDSYALARYGRTDEHILSSWHKLLNSCYSSPTGYQEGPPENVLCARPRLDIRSTSSWGTCRKFYNPKTVEQAMNEFLLAEQNFPNSATYRTDAVLLIAQNTMDNADSAYALLQQAYREKDIRAFQAAGTGLLSMLMGLDKLFSLCPEYSLDAHIKQAMAAGTTPEEKRNNVHNLLMLITYWGGNEETSHALDDYSYRHLSGLFGSFYAARWKLFTDALEKKMKDPSVPLPDFGRWHRQWVEQQMKTYFP